MPTSQISLLKNIYLFKDLTQRELELVNSIVKLVVYSAGDELFVEGDHAHSLYVIRFGSVKLQHLGETHTIENAALGSGSHFGEIAFIDQEKRTASVIVMERTEMVCIEFDALRALLDENLELSVKVYKALSLFLAGRLRLTTIDLKFAREKNIRHF